MNNINFQTPKNIKLFAIIMPRARYNRSTKIYYNFFQFKGSELYYIHTYTEIDGVLYREPQMRTSLMYDTNDGGAWK